MRPDQKIIIQATGFEVTEAMEAQARKYLQKAWTIDAKIEKIEIYLDIQKRRDDSGCTVKFNVVRAGKNVIVKQEGKDVYKCLAEGAKSTLRAIRKEKENRVFRRPPARRFTAVDFLPDGSLRSPRTPPAGSPPTV